MKGKKKGIRSSVTGKKTTLKLKLSTPNVEKNAIKHLYNERLEKLFSQRPSNFGYQSDIEGIMNELAITKDQLFHMVINSLGRSTRTKPEIRVIASYLFLMQDFLQLLKAKNIGEKENLLLKDLITLAENVDYERAQINTVLMRFGEKGNNAFIILDGKVDVLIESHFNLNIGDKTYLYYIANLIKYHEFGLVNSIINENFKKFPMEIIDDITIKYPMYSSFKQNKNSTDYAFYNTTNKKDEAVNNSIDSNDNDNVEGSLKKSERFSVVIKPIQKGVKFSINSEMFKRFKRTNTVREKPEDDDKKSKKKRQGVFRLSYINEEFKESHKIPRYSAKGLLDMFELKLIDKRFNRDLNHITCEEYIKRLNIFNEIKSDELFLKVKKEREEKIHKSKKKFKFKKKKGKKDKDKPKDKEKDKDKDKDDDKEKDKDEDKEKSNDDKVSGSKSISNNSNNNSISNKDNDNSENENNNSQSNDMGESKESNESEDEGENESSDSFEESSSSHSLSYINLMNEKIIENIKLCTYSKIITLERGALFGEMALNEPNATRKATIITSSDCHFAVLNKKTFNNSIKMGAQRHMKETLQFFIEIPIFHGIPEGVFYNKYYTNLSKEIMVKGKNVINQGEKPDHITLLQTGSYGLTTTLSLYDLTRLILYYADVLINQTNKKAELSKNNDKNSKKGKDKANTINKKENKKKDENKKEEKKNKMNDFNDLQKILSQESALLAESISFKKYYFTPQYIRINEIYCPEVIINDEYTDENGVYAFTIEAKSPENTIYTLDNKFLVDINEKNISIQKNKEKFLKQKIDLMVKRLLIIRNSLINQFFDSKAKKEIGAAVIKELEDAILLNLKKKRLLNKKEEIIINSKQRKTKEKLKLLNLNSSLGKSKNYELGKRYRNNDDLNKDNNYYNNRYNLTTYKMSTNKVKSINLHESYKYENDLKEKLNNNKSENNKMKLKPLNVSLKTAIMYTTRESEEYKRHHSRRNIKNIKNLKNYDEGLLFSLNDIDNNKYSKTNINFNSSRNNDIKMNLKPFNSFYGEHNFKDNNFALVKTNKVFMNNLIWEKMKSGGNFPIKLNIDDLINNANENNLLLDENTINTNYKTYYSQKLYYNKHPYKNNYSNEINNSTKKANLFSKDFSFKNIQIENQNNLCFLSSQSKSNQMKNNKSYSPKKNNIERNNKTVPKSIQSLKSFKKNEVLQKLKIRKIISPEEIQFMRMNRKMRFVMDGNKYNKVKEEKFKSTWKNYFKRNIVNRINFFYGKAETEKK